MTHLIESTWLNFKQRPSKDSIFADDAVVVYVPTGAGARGASEIRKMYLSGDHNQRVNTVKETIRKRTVTPESIVEECEWHITFTTGTCDWLVPKLDSGIFTDCSIMFPVVISASFKAEKISILRFYWDQSTVLKQLKVISPREHARWPVLGTEGIQYIRDPTAAHLNPLTKDGEVLPAGGSIKPNETSEAQPKPRVLPGMQSRVFAQEDEPTPAVSAKPKHDNHARLFGGGDEPPPPRQTTTTASRSYKPERRNILGGDDEEPMSATSSSNAQKGRTSNRIFGGDEEEPPVTSSQKSRTSNRIFGGGEEEAPKVVKPKVKSSIFDDGTEEPFRPTSRVTHPGGGGGKSRVFSDDADVEERRAFSYNPQKYASQISMSNEDEAPAPAPVPALKGAPAPEPAPEPAEEPVAEPVVEEETVPAPAPTPATKENEPQEESQRDPRRSSRSINPNKNVTQWSLGGEASESDNYASSKKSTRSINPDKNTAQWELGGETNEADAPKTRTAFTINPNKHASQWAPEGNVGDGGMPKPSTRVIQNPGGKSSIQLM